MVLELVEGVGGRGGDVLERLLAARDGRGATARGAARGGGGGEGGGKSRRRISAHLVYQQ